MITSSPATNQIQYVDNFQDLVTTPFQGEINAVCWTRELTGDFSEIVKTINSTENITTFEREELLALKLTQQGQLARDILLSDMELLKAHGASPTLNLIKFYDRDDAYDVMSTDVYSFHVDRSPVPTDTFLCTYYGEASEILPNAQAIQKVLVPEIRGELKKLYQRSEEGFEIFLTEHFFDLHYADLPSVKPVNLGCGNLWRLAVDHPGSKVLPCIHRAPLEKKNETRLLMIC